MSEATQTQLRSPYGESKLMLDRILGWYDRCFGVRSVSLRYFNAAGASLDGHIGEIWDATQNLVPAVMKAALGQGPKVTIFGSNYPLRTAQRFVTTFMSSTWPQRSFFGRSGRCLDSCAAEAARPDDQ